MKALTDQSLQPCDPNSQPLSEADIQSHLCKLDYWVLNTENKIEQIAKTYTFKNFAEALSFTNDIAALAEQKNHHPKICLEWGRVTISWWTHSVNGLFINDFIMAAKCDAIFASVVP